MDHVLRDAGCGHEQAELLAWRVGQVLDEGDAVAFRVAELEAEVAVPAFAYSGGNGDAFAGEIVAHGFGIGSLEGYFDRAVFVFRLQCFVDLEVLVIVNFKPGGETEARGHSESVREAEIVAVETARGGEVIGFERDMGDTGMVGAYVVLREEN